MAFKKHRILFIVSLVALLALLPAGFASAQLPDITGHWAETQINEWFNKGLIKGTADGTFKPNNDITRAEFVTMTNRAFGFTESGSITFSDVSPTNWFANEVSIAGKAGYIRGFVDGTFKPVNKITRQEVAAILTRLLDLNITGGAAEADNYIDAAKIQNWSKESVGAVSKAGIMSGYQDKTFGPQNSITRAEALVTLDRAMKYDPPVAPKDPTEEVSVTGVKLDKTSVSVKEGNTVQLKATVEPEDATNKKIKWSSSDKDVATVDDNGLVKGIKWGTATITVTTDDGGKTATCKVEVTFTLSGGGSSISDSKDNGSDDPPDGKLIKSVNPIADITVTAGQAVVLPKTVRVTYNNGTTGEVAVAWNSDEFDFIKAGTYQLTGTIKGTEKTASVTVIVEAEAEEFEVIDIS